MSAVAVLYARADSVYKSIGGCDVWDAERDARKWAGGSQVVAHPPCRAWGRLRHMAKPRDDERELARHAVTMVRRWGGVLEHPASSVLWADAGLPKPGERADEWGGWTLPVKQLWWGHRAEKKTWLYIVGCAAKGLPPIQLTIDYPTCDVERMGRAERERTPPDLAAWLVETAMRCRGAAA